MNIRKYEVTLEKNGEKIVRDTFYCTAESWDLYQRRRAEYDQALHRADYPEMRRIAPFLDEAQARIKRYTEETLHPPGEPKPVKHNNSKCKYCGALIDWLTSSQGRKYPAIPGTTAPHICKQDPLGVIG